MNVQSIEVALIDPPLFNSRLDDNKGTNEELAALGHSLMDDQKQPIRVVALNNGERYRLIFGSRRVAAAKLVGLSRLNADVLEASDEADEVLTNGVENVQRRDLSTFEQARLCAKLRAYFPTSKAVAEKLGFSQQHVSNLAVCYEKLPELIKSAWQHGDEGTDMNFLRSIITKKVDGKTVANSEDEMIALFHERAESLAEVTGDEEEDEEDEETEEDETPGSDGPKPPQPYKVERKRYRDLLRALRGARAAQVTIDAVRYLVGDIEKIRGIAIGDAKAPTKKTNNATKEGK